MFCLILEFTNNLDQWQVYKNLQDMIWHMRSQPQNFGIMAWMLFLLYDKVQDQWQVHNILHDMIWYMRIHPQNFGIKAWLYDLIYKKCSCLFLAFLTLRIASSQTKFKSYKKNFKIKTEAFKLCVIFARYGITSPYCFLNLFLVLILLEITQSPPLTLFIRIRI